MTKFRNYNSNKVGHIQPNTKSEYNLIAANIRSKRNPIGTEAKKNQKILTKPKRIEPCLSSWIAWGQPLPSPSPAVVILSLTGMRRCTVVRAHPSVIVGSAVTMHHRHCCCVESGREISNTHVWRDEGLK